jgi:hypothetical protein
MKDNVASEGNHVALARGYNESLSQIDNTSMKHNVASEDNHVALARGYHDSVYMGFSPRLYLVGSRCYSSGNCQDFSTPSFA